MMNHAALEIARTWRGCELDSHFLKCLATMHPFTYWAAVVIFWAVVIVCYILWTGKRSV